MSTQEEFDDSFNIWLANSFISFSFFHIQHFRVLLYFFLYWLENYKLVSKILVVTLEILIHVCIYLLPINRIGK